MADLTEVDVLMELVLPLFLEQREQTMARFGHTVHLSVRLEGSVRSWTLTGGERPWLVRGHNGEPDLELVLSERLVTWVLSDSVPAFAKLIEEGDLGLRGDRRVLERLDATWADAQTLLGTLADKSRR